MVAFFRPAGVLVLTVTVIGMYERVGAEDPPKLSFPQVKGWVHSKPRPLPAGSGGYSVGYDSDDRTAVTVYVYNRGLASIPNNLAAKEMQKEFATAKEAVREAKRLGIYENLQEQESGEAVLGGRKPGLKALYARFLLRIEKQDTVSEIYLLPHRNHFIKLRVTRPEKEIEKTQGSLDRLYAELSKLLAN